MAFPLMPIPMLGAKAFKFDITTSFIAAPSGTTSLRNCPYPAGSQEGDLIIAIFGCSNTATPFTGAGWTIAATQAVGALRTRISYQFYPSSAPATASITVSPGSEGFGCVMLRIPRAAFDAVGVFDLNTSPTVPVGPTAAGGMAIAIFRGSLASSVWSTPAGMDLVLARADPNYFNFAIFSQLVPAGAVGSRSSTAALPGSLRHGIILTVKKAS